MPNWKPWTWGRNSYEDRGDEDAAYLIPTTGLTDEQFLDSPCMAMFNLTSPRQYKQAILIQQMENIAGQSFRVKRIYRQQFLDTVLIGGIFSPLFPCLPDGNAWLEGVPHILRLRDRSWRIPFAVR